MYFFLSLIFRKNKYSSHIFFYFENYNKMFFFNDMPTRCFNAVYHSVIKYFELIDKLLFQNKNSNHWMLHKNTFLIFYKNENDSFADMYSLNFNMNIPKFNDMFF